MKCPTRIALLGTGPANHVCVQRTLILRSCLYAQVLSTGVYSVLRRQHILQQWLHLWWHIPLLHRALVPLPSIIDAQADVVPDQHPRSKATCVQPSFPCGNTLSDLSCAATACAAGSLVRHSSLERNAFKPLLVNRRVVVLGATLSSAAVLPAAVMAMLLT